MTLEELEIIVTAKVEEALKEFQKILPAIKEAMKQAEETFSKVDTKTMTNKLHKAVNFMKKKMQDLKKSSENNEIAIKVNNKDAQKQITQIQKQIDSLQEKINARQLKLNIITPKLDEITQKTIKEVTPAGVSPDNPAMQPVIENALNKNKDYTSLSAQENKLVTEIEAYNKQLSIAKEKAKGLKSEIKQTGTSQNKLTSFFGTFKEKISKIDKGQLIDMFSNIPDLTAQITTKIKGMTTGLRNGLKHITRYVLALFSIRGIYSVLSSSAQSWLSAQNAGAKQLSANIDYMKYAMGSAFAPVIQWVTGLVYNLMKAVQSVVYALFKVNIFANASAKSYTSMASSAKKAKEEMRQLVGIHDEINNIQNNNSDSGDGGTQAPSFDLSGIDSQLSPFAQKLHDFFKPLVDSWNTYGQQLVAQLKITAGQVGNLFSAVWGSFEKIITNGTVYTTLGLILAIIGNIAQAFANAWNYNGNGDAIVQNLANAFNNLLIAINNVIQSPAFQSWLNWCSDKFREISEKIASINWQPLINALMQIGTTIGTIALNILSGLVDIFKWLAENPIVAEIILGIAVAISVVSTVLGVLSTIMTVLTPIVAALGVPMSALIAIVLAVIAVIALIVLAITNWDSIMQALNNTFGGVLNTISESINTLYNEHIKPLIDNIMALLQTLWNDVLKPLIDWFVANVLPVLVPIFEGLWNTISNVVGSIVDVISGVIETLKGIIEFIVGIFTGDWEKAWQGIEDFFSGIWNTIKGIVSTVWNAITGTITTAANAIKDTITAVFNGIWNTIRNVINSILGGIESMANGVVNGVNSIIRVLNNLKFDIPSWIPGLGGKTFGFSISTLNTVSLPRLAKGGIIDSPTVAMMGEYSGAKSNPEIVTPQNIMEETFDRVFSRHERNDNNQTIQLTVNVSNKKLGQILLDDLKDMKRRSGNGIEALIGG